MSDESLATQADRMETPVGINVYAKDGKGLGKWLKCGGTTKTIVHAKMFSLLYTGTLSNHAKFHFKYIAYCLHIKRFTP